MPSTRAAAPGSTMPAGRAMPATAGNGMGDGRDADRRVRRPLARTDARFLAAPRRLKTEEKEVRPPGTAISARLAENELVEVREGG